MKNNLFHLLLIFGIFFSCKGLTENENLSHLSDTTYTSSNPTSNIFSDYDLYDRMLTYKVPGISIAVVKDGKIIIAEGYGKADIDINRNVDSKTLFQAASISKPIAALGILKLAEQKRVNLDEDVNKYLTSFRIPENRYTSDKKVTLRAILAHTAGLNVEGFVGYHVAETLPSTQAVLRGEGNSSSVNVIAVPGSQWHYSGGGYTVMQQVIEDVSGQSFEAFMKVEILEPLGMTNSTFTQPLPTEYYSNASSAFDLNGMLLDGKWHNYPEKAAAGLWTTPTDLAKYAIHIQEIYTGKISNGVISKDLVKQMFANHYQSYNFQSNTANIPQDYKAYWGQGLEMAVKGDTIRFQHAGFNEGFKVNLTAFANEGTAIVIMANADNGFDLIMEVEEILSDKYNLGIWQ